MTRTRTRRTVIVAGGWIWSAESAASSHAGQMKTSAPSTFSSRSHSRAAAYAPPLIGSPLFARAGDASSERTQPSPNWRLQRAHESTRPSPRRAPQAPRDVSARLAQSTHGESAAAAAYVSRGSFFAGVGACTFRGTGGAVRAPPSRRIAPMISARISRTSLHPSATCRARCSSTCRGVRKPRCCFAVDRLGDVASDSSAAGGSSSPRGWTPPAGRAASPTGAAQAAGADMSRFRASFGPFCDYPPPRSLFDKSSHAL